MVEQPTKELGLTMLLEAAALVQHDSRPEFYDFDLFARAGQGAPGGDWADTPLAELAYTVFDTETTGLSPFAGDRVIELAAVVLVLDATTGQNALSQIEIFKEVAGVTGLIMTKLDRKSVV